MDYRGRGAEFRRFRKAGYAAIDQICDYYTTLHERPVRATVEPGYLLEQLPRQSLVNYNLHNLFRTCCWNLINMVSMVSRLTRLSRHPTRKGRRVQPDNPRFPEPDPPGDHALATPSILRLFPVKLYFRIDPG